PGIERRPEAEERAERKREEQAIVGPQSCEAKHRLPAAKHGLPAGRRVEPAQRPAGRSRGLVQSAVALAWVGQRCATRRVLFLVGQQLGLTRQRQPSQIGGAWIAARSIPAAANFAA